MSGLRSLTELEIQKPALVKDPFRDVHPDERDIVVRAAGLEDLERAETKGENTMAWGTPPPTLDQRLSAGVYLAAVIARLHVALDRVHADLAKEMRKQNVRWAGIDITGEAYCDLDPVGVPDPRQWEDLAPGLILGVHRKRASWWIERISETLELIHGLDVGAIGVDEDQEESA